MRISALEAQQSVSQENPAQRVRSLCGCPARLEKCMGGASTPPRPFCASWGHYSWWQVGKGGSAAPVFLSVLKVSMSMTTLEKKGCICGQSSLMPSASSTQPLAILYSMSSLAFTRPCCLRYSPLGTAVGAFGSFRPWVHMPSGGWQQHGGTVWGGRVFTAPMGLE